MWDKRSLILLDKEVGMFTVSCLFKNVSDGIVWDFTGVYGPLSKDRRSLLWEELGAITGLWEAPWCIGGDFNVTLFPSERSTMGRLNSSMRRFSEVICDLELVDLPMSGGNFTWRGGMSNQTMARLDRFLVSLDWMDHLGNVTQRKLPRPTSDHAPIPLECGGARRGPTPFRFENMWLKANGFQLKAWDQVEEERELFMEEAEAKKEAKDAFRKWASLEEIHWRQKSREIWLREGDRNTGFFHRMANSHFRKNFMASIKINGVWLIEDQEMREGISNAFQSLFLDNMDRRAEIDGLSFASLNPKEAISLEVPFREEEVFIALNDMDGDKASRPDGFTLAFW